MKPHSALACAVILTFAIHQPSTAEIPPAAQKILDRARDEVKNAIKNAIGVAEKGLTDLKGLNNDQQQEVAKLVQPGNLQTAILGMQPVAPILAKLEGSWKHDNSRFTRKFGLVDGGFQVEEFAGEKLNARGPCKENPNGVVTADLGNGYTLEIRMAGDNRIAILIWNAQKKLHEVGEVADRLEIQNPTPQAR